MSTSGEDDFVEALRRIPEAQRRAVVLHHLGDLPVDEVARLENCPVGTIKARLSRGRTALSVLLAEDATSLNGVQTHA